MRRAQGQVRQQTDHTLAIPSAAGCTRLLHSEKPDYLLNSEGKHRAELVIPGEYGSGT